MNTVSLVSMESYLLKFRFSDLMQRAEHLQKALSKYAALFHYCSAGFHNHSYSELDRNGEF